jgi:hypothetical protein
VKATIAGDARLVVMKLGSELLGGANRPTPIAIHEWRGIQTHD